MLFNLLKLGLLRYENLLTYTVLHCIARYTKRQLSQLRAAWARPAKKALRVPRFRGETDEHYHRRLNRTLAQTTSDAAVGRIDCYVLKRMYDYTGHLVRVLSLIHI